MRVKVHVTLNELLLASFGPSTLSRAFGTNLLAIPRLFPALLRSWRHAVAATC